MVFKKGNSKALNQCDKCLTSRVIRETETKDPRDTLLPTSTHLHQVCTHRLGDAMGNRSLPCRWWEHTARTLGRGRCLSIRLSPDPATHANPGPCRHSRVPCCQGYIRRATAAVFVMVKSQPTQEPYRNAASDAPGGIVRSC